MTDRQQDHAAVLREMPVDAMRVMLRSLSDDIAEMAGRQGASRFPSAAQLRGWKRMADSILAQLPTPPQADTTGGQS